VLYDVVVEVDERVILHDETCQMNLMEKNNVYSGNNARKFIIERQLDDAEVEQSLRDILVKGIHSIAVLFMHSYMYVLCALIKKLFLYRFPEHEKRVGAIASRLGFLNISLSFDVMPMMKIVPRGYTSIHFYFF
jgi:5-oxoprolinase (ATP-hydrolysing)